MREVSDQVWERWSETPPSEPGWYWFKGSGFPAEAVEIYVYECSSKDVDERHGELVVAATNESCPEKLSSMRGEWYSEPIEVPE